jgi:lactose/L-arabinose transport system permease protein
MTNEARIEPPVRIYRWLLYFAITIGAAISLIPFYWMLVAATNKTSDLFKTPPPLWFGSELSATWSRLINDHGFMRAIFNSLLIAVVYTVLSSILSAMCGYALAKYRFRGRGLLLSSILMTMMVPFQVLLVPLFQMMATLKWIDSYQAVIVPFLANAFGIFMMRQGFMDFPNEILEAARIDGASEMRTFYTIVLPVAKPQLAAVIIFTFISQWNAFIWPLLMLNSPEKMTVPLVLSSMIGLTHVDYSAIMLGAFVSTLPILIFFTLFQRQLVSGLLGGSIK